MEKKTRLGQIVVVLAFLLSFKYPMLLIVFRIKSESCAGSSSKACREKQRRDKLNDKYLIFDFFVVLLQTFIF